MIYNPDRHPIPTVGGGRLGGVEALLGRGPPVWQREGAAGLGVITMGVAGVFPVLHSTDVPKPAGDELSCSVGGIGIPVEDGKEDKEGEPGD